MNYLKIFLLSLFLLSNISTANEVENIKNYTIIDYRNSSDKFSMKSSKIIDYISKKETITDKKFNQSIKTYKDQADYFFPINIKKISNESISLNYNEEKITNIREVNGIEFIDKVLFSKKTTLSKNKILHFSNNNYNYYFYWI